MTLIVRNNLWPVIRANLRLADKSKVAIGFPGESEKTRKAHGQSGMTTGQVAVSNEVGSAPGVRPEVPARPFVKETVKRHGQDLVNKASEQLRMISRGEQTTHRALIGLGKIGADKVQETITDSPSWAKPNKTFTVAKKRSSTPLIDTGIMRASVTYKVRMRGSGGQG